VDLNGYMVLGSAIVGLLVGMTGAGGGALMTPMLIFMFGVTPSAAISSDLVAAVVMRPVGAAVHLKRGTVNLRMVGWLAIGSVPAAILGALLLRTLGTGADAETRIEIILGTALLLGAGSMALRALTRRGHGGLLPATELDVRPLPTVAIGLVGGLMVGLTSVGSGSLMIVLLLFLYPAVSASGLVGTDLVQAIPLTAAAALGQLLFGHVVFAVTLSVIIGSVPAVLVGSLVSSRAPDRLLRPIIFFVLLASGLKYVGVGTTALAWTMGGVLAASGLGWLVVSQRRVHRDAGGAEDVSVPRQAGSTGATDPAASPTA